MSEHTLLPQSPDRLVLVFINKTEYRNLSSFMLNLTKVGETGLYEGNDENMAGSVVSGVILGHNGIFYGQIRDPDGTVWEVGDGQPYQPHQRLH